MTFLKTFFFGNVDPQSRAVKPGSRADKLRIYITDHLPEIENSLSDDQRGALDKILNAQSELDTISELDSFIVGFRLGAAFTYDTFVNTDTGWEYELKKKVYAATGWKHINGQWEFLMPGDETHTVSLDLLFFVICTNFAWNSIMTHASRRIYAGRRETLRALVTTPKSDDMADMPT